MEALERDETMNGIKILEKRVSGAAVVFWVPLTHVLNTMTVAAIRWMAVGTSPLKKEKTDAAIVKAMNNLGVWVIALGESSEAKTIDGRTCGLIGAMIDERDALTILLGHDNLDEIISIITELLKLVPAIIDEENKLAASRFN